MFFFSYFSLSHESFSIYLLHQMRAAVSSMIASDAYELLKVLVAIWKSRSVVLFLHQMPFSIFSYNLKFQYYVAIHYFFSFREA